MNKEELIKLTAIKADTTQKRTKTLLGSPKQELPHSPQTPKEILAAMKAASNNYYREAIATNCHTFIEFTGLINEYIKICERNLQQRGIDFTNTSVHADGPRLHIENWELNYINEKLCCIFPELLLVKTENAEMAATDK
jgi:hypothetical protein